MSFYLSPVKPGLDTCLLRSKTQCSSNEYSTQPPTSLLHYQDNLEEFPNYLITSDIISSQKQNYQMLRNSQAKSFMGTFSSEFTSPIEEKNLSSTRGEQKNHYSSQLSTIISQDSQVQVKNQLLEQLKIQLVRKIDILVSKNKKKRQQRISEQDLTQESTEKFIQDSYDFYQEFRSNFCMKPTQITKAIKEIAKQQQYDLAMNIDDDDYEDLKCVFSQTTQQQNNMKDKQNYVKGFLDEFHVQNVAMASKIAQIKQIGEGYDKVMENKQSELRIELQKKEYLQKRICEEESLQYLLSKN